MSLARVLQLPLLRKPLFVLVVLEALIVLGVVATAWHVWHSRQQASAPVVGGLPAPRQTLGTGPARLPPPSGNPAAGSPRSPAATPKPGLGVDADFLTRQLRDVNREQAALEAIEWRLARAAMQGMRSYLEGVVLPRVERAEARSR